MNGQWIKQANVSNVGNKTRAARRGRIQSARRREKDGRRREGERNESVSAEHTNSIALSVLSLVVVRIMRRWVNCQVKSEMAASEQQRKVSERRGDRGRRGFFPPAETSARKNIGRTLSIPRDETCTRGASLLCQKLQLIHLCCYLSCLILHIRVYVYIRRARYRRVTTKIRDDDEFVIRSRVDRERRTIPGITRGTDIPRARRIPG